MVRNKQSLVQKFGKQIEENSSIQSVQKSMSQLRVLLKQLNIVLNNMVSKSYELMNQKQVPQINHEREIQILKNKYENCKKLLQTQQTQIASLSNTFYDLQSKQNYLQDLIQQINEIRQKVTQGSLKSKNNTSDVSRNGYNLVNKQIYDAKQLNRIKNMSTQIEKTRQKFKKQEQKLQTLNQKQKQMASKYEQISIKLQKQIINARNKQFQVTSQGVIISYQQKYQQTLSKKNAEIKKKALIQHVMKSNEETVNKKINDMKQLAKSYDNKQSSLQQKINKKSKQIEKLIDENSKIVSNFTHRSLPLKYIETMLKGQKSKDNKNQDNDDYNNQYFQDYDGLNNSQIKISENKKQQNKKQVKILKPNLIMRRKRNTSDLQSFERSKSIQQIQLKTHKLPSKSLNDQQNVMKPTHKKYPSANELMKNNTAQTNNVVEKSILSPKIKYWRKQIQNQSTNIQEKDNHINQVINIKPDLNIKKKVNNLNAESTNNQILPKIANRQDAKQQNDNLNIAIAPRFTRLSHKRVNNKANDEYMSYLQQKGKKILGIS